MALVFIFALFPLSEHTKHVALAVQKNTKPRQRLQRLSVYLARMEGKSLSSGSALLGDKLHAVLNQAANFKVTLSF